MYERCVVGGPGVDPRDRLPPPTSSLAGEPLRTVIGENVHLSASAEIEAGTCLEDACLIESRAMIKKGVKVGKHSKVCAGCVVDRDVGEWVVVWGDGEARRMRKGAEVPEMGRLKALEREREATVGLLRAAAARATLGKRRG